MILFWAGASFLVLLNKYSSRTNPNECTKISVRTSFLIIIAELNATEIMFEWKTISIKIGKSNWNDFFLSKRIFIEVSMRISQNLFLVTPKIT